MPPSTSPFKEPPIVERKIKGMLFGVEASGKTHLSLTAPGPIGVIDTEGGTTWFAGRKGINPFKVLPTKSYRETLAALDWIVANPGEIGTLVIDPITILYDQLQESQLVIRTKKAGAKAARNRDTFDPDDVDLEMLDWGKIKGRWKALMRRLTTLPCHVLVTAREKDITERRGSEMVKVGVRADAEKGAAYEFDVVIRMTKRGAKRVGIVEKDRTGGLPLGSEHEDPTFDSLFGRFISAKVKGEVVAREVIDEEAAAEADAAAFARKDDAQEAAIAAKGRASARRNAAGTPEASQGTPDTSAGQGDAAVEMASPALVVQLMEALAAADVDADNLRAQRSLPPFTEMPAEKVTRLLDWAKAKAEALAATQAEEAREESEAA